LSAVALPGWMWSCPVIGFPFPWCLMVSSIFSQVYWPLVHLQKCLFKWSFVWFWIVLFVGLLWVFSVLESYLSSWIWQVGHVLWWVLYSCHWVLCQASHIVLVFNPVPY
jgi:hypothetical protein